MISTTTSAEFIHKSVLGEEAPEALVTDPDGLYVDATFGRGGHTRRILAKLSPKGRVIAFDRDPEAVKAAAALTDPRFMIIHAPFSRMAEELAAHGISRVTGVLMDIGVSSPQIDDAERGFSFRMDGPLDMRMDTDSGITAAEWLEKAGVSEIERVLKVYGEERFAGRIARALVSRRAEKPFLRTADLAQAIAAAVPRSASDPKQHPATRSFQAIRIFINGELDELKAALSAAGALLAPAGKLAVISFHSLEDRIVKHFLEAGAHPERLIDSRIVLAAREMPAPWWKDVERVKPGKSECDVNPRARSAVMRVAVRTDRVWDESAGGVP